MQTIDRDRLYTDLVYRFTYVAGFVDFGDADKKAIHDAAVHLAPLVPTVVDAVYTKLFNYDITKKFFADRMEGFKGKALTDLKEIDQNCEQIKFRKDMLSRYIVKLVSAEYNESFIKYLDWVALIHTKNSQKSTSINVEYIHINALLTYVSSILIGAISDLPIDAATKKRTLLAFNKLLWIQNDLFAQYYVHDGEELPQARANVKGVEHMRRSSGGEACCSLGSCGSTTVMAIAAGAISVVAGVYLYLTKK